MPGIKPDLLVLNVGYSRRNADWNWANIRSPFARLYCVTAGHAQIRMESGMYNLTPGHLYLIPSFVLNSDFCDSQFEHYYLHIYEDDICEGSLFEDFSFPVELASTEEDVRLFGRLCDINPEMSLADADPSSYDNSPSLIRTIEKSRSSAYGDFLETRGLVDILISRFMREASPKPAYDDRIRKSISYIRRHLDSNVSISELAQMCSMSEEYYIRFFRHELGESPHSYILSRKIERAQLLLTVAQLPVKSIALSLGFADCSYFSRLFRNRTGMTPQQYRLLKQ